MFHQILCPQGSQNPITTMYRPLPPQAQDLIIFRRIFKGHSQNFILSCWSEESKRLSKTLQFIGIAFSSFHKKEGMALLPKTPHTWDTEINRSDLEVSSLRISSRSIGRNHTSCQREKKSQYSYLAVMPRNYTMTRLKIYRKEQ